MRSQLAERSNEIAILPTLASVRSEIDRIDGDLLDLIERRLACSFRVAELKEADDYPQLHLRPDREQQIIDTLSRQAERLTPDAVSDIWRALMAVSLQAQQHVELQINADRRAVAVTDAARRRFGNAATLEAAATPQRALERAREHDAIAVIELDPLSDWWTFKQEHAGLVLFDTLRDKRGGIVALAIGRVPRESLPPTDDLLMVLTRDMLRERLELGETIAVLAMHGEQRLCLAEGAMR